ncbi:unnamed protein product [Cladocopium goreaui]|uniref:Uncharacterized protein n=1 Tax=Cladocopium goreaui TaxID=2562237 RepID=A0A9P1BYS4_9DINO|nr:unnamed protein product [Cladocopium goreaui]
MSHKLTRVVRPPAMSLDELKAYLVSQHPELAEDPKHRPHAVHDCVEVFGQSGAIQSGFRKYGMSAAAFDYRVLAVRLSPEHNVHEVKGLKILANLLYEAKELWGTSSSKPVVVGNAKAEVTTTVVMPLAEWLGLEDATEQPDSSLMLKWPGYEEWMRILDERYALYKTRVKLGAFGGLSWKGLKLAGAWGGIELLEMVYQLLWWITSNHLTQFSALYPGDFGDCIAWAHKVKNELAHFAFMGEAELYVGSLVIRGFPSVQEVVHAAEEKCKSMGGSIDTDPGWEDADRWVTAPIPRKVVRQWLREKRERVEDEAHARKVQKGIKKKGSPRKQEKQLKGPGPKTVTKSCEKTTKVENTSKTSRTTRGSAKHIKDKQSQVAKAIPMQARCAEVLAWRFAFTLAIGLTLMRRFSSSPKGGRRKAKSLKLTSKHVKISDLRCAHVATILAFQHGSLSPQSLMTVGGECYELRKHSLNNLKLTESTRALELRVDLTKEVHHYEKKWRDRLLNLLEAGLIYFKTIKTVATELKERLENPDTGAQFLVKLKQSISDFKEEYRYDGTLDGVRVGRFAPKPRLGTGTDGTSEPEKSPSNQQNVMEDKMISFFQKELNSSFKQLGEQRLFIKETCNDLLDAVEHGWTPSVQSVGQAAKEVLLLMTWIARKNGESFAKALKEDLANQRQRWEECVKVAGATCAEKKAEEPPKAKEGEPTPQPGGLANMNLEDGQDDLDK